MSHNGKIKQGIYIQQNLISHEKEEGTDVCHNVDGTGNITLSERKLPYATGAAKKKKKNQNVCRFYPALPGSQPRSQLFCSSQL